MLKVVAIVL